MGMQAKLDIDSNIFEVVDKTVLKDGWMLTMYNEENNAFLLEITDDAFEDKSAYIYDNEQMIKLTLKVKDQAKPGKAEIKLTDVQLADSNFDVLEVEEAKQMIKINGINMNVVFIIVGIVIIILAVAILVKKRKK